MRAIVILSLLALACQDPNDTSFRGDFRIKLVDAPAVYDAVNIVIRRVSVHRASSGQSFGWTVISEDVKVFDLLNLRNGVSATLASATLPVGRYDKVLILYGISNLIENGFERTVYVPDQYEDGAVVDVEFEVTEGGLLGLTFDMDVTRSIRTRSDGRYELHPVIRVQRTDLAGSIAGGIVPDSVLEVVTTVAGGDSISTYSLALQGINAFQLVDLPEGSYDVRLQPSVPDFLDTVLTDVVVVPRQTTQLGAIVLRPRPNLP